MDYRTQGSNPVLVAAFGGHVVGVERASGRRLWIFKGRETGRNAQVRVMVIGQVVYAAPIDDHLVLLDYITGREVARTKIPNPSTRTMMHVDEHIYFGGNESLDCFALDGRLLWSNRFDDLTTCRPVSLAVPGHAVQGDLG